MLDDSHLLLTDAERLLSEIEQVCQTTLTSKSIPPTLRVRTKQFLDNIRSALDFLAFEVFTRFCAPGIQPSEITKAERRVYFPVRDDRAEFLKAVDTSFPGLNSTRPDLVSALQSPQPFQTGTPWLKHLVDLSNENKHRQLAPQTKTETKQVRATAASGQVSWIPAQVQFGPGVFINGVPIDPRTQLPYPSPSQRVEITTWVGIEFTGSKLGVLPTLKEILAGAKNTVATIEPLL